jgi:hypothetical protein
MLLTDLFTLTRYGIRTTLHISGNWRIPFYLGTIIDFPRKLTVNEEIFL